MNTLESLKFSLEKITFDVFLNRAIWIILGTLMICAIYYIIQIGNAHVPEDKRISFNIKKLAKYFLIAVLCFIVYLIFKNNKSMRYLLNTTIISLIFAYVLNPAVKYFESKNIKRNWAILLIYFLAFLIVSLLLITIVPRTISEFKKLITNFPTYVDQAQGIISDLSVKYIGKDIFEIQNIKWKDIVTNVFSNIESNMGGFMTGIKSTISKTLMAILVPVFTFYFLSDKEEFIKRVKCLIPKKHNEKIMHLLAEIDTQVHQYIKGKALASVFVGVLTGVLLAICGVDFAFIIGLITIFADIIPYIGPFISLTPAFVFALIDSPIKAVCVLIIFPVANWLQNNIVGPKIFADTLGIHPMAVLVSILIGGFTFGFVGMIFALPVVIVGEVIYNEYKIYRENKNKELRSNNDK